MKKDPLLFILVICVGVFSYFAAFKGEVHIWMIPILVALTGLWYVCNNVVTRKMILKRRNGEEFFFVRAGLVSNNETEIISGALVATSSEIIIYKRKGYLGGITPIWSCFLSQLESYSMEKVDDKHYGIILSLKNENDKIKVVSRSIGKQENEFRRAIGW